ncbi:MAG: PKD domain-containing protein [Bacteroidales bacterium]
MKKILYIAILIPLVLTSCTRDPYADFVADRRVVEVGEEVYFTNRSMDAIDYEWDFGDGYYSYNFNAAHSWTVPGFYTVTLTAFGKDGKLDRALMDIEVIQPLAELEITVEEYYEPYYLVPDVRVRLYPTLDDWDNESNLVVEGYTNSSGKVLFVDLPANRRYYVEVFGDYHDNIALGLQDDWYNWIETDVLKPGVRNYFTAVADYYPDGKKSGKKLRIDSRSSDKIERNGTRPERIKPEGIIQEVR